MIAKLLTVGVISAVILPLAGVSVYRSSLTQKDYSVASLNSEEDAAKKFCSQLGVDVNSRITETTSRPEGGFDEKTTYCSVTRTRTES